jgi:hypothetical protein
MIIDTKCKKCGVTIKLDFGNLTREQAEEFCEKLDRTPRECPGMHCELGGWKKLWGLSEAVHRAYDLGEGEQELEVPSDKEYVKQLVAQGEDVYDGGLNTVPELELPNIHSVRDLEHLGFGDFRNATHTFLRCDSPRGSRFYMRQPNCTT